MANLIDLQSADGFVFPAYVAEPAGKPKGAVVVLQEIFGVNSHIRSVADGYAAAGYLAVAPATFHRAKPGVEMGYTEPDMNAGFALKTAVEALPAPNAATGRPEQVQPLEGAAQDAKRQAWGLSPVLQDIQAAISHAAQTSEGKVGIVGFCWGGLLTWRAACTLSGLSAAVPYYGGGMTAGDEPTRKPACPVMAHFGNQDHWIPLDTVEVFKKAQPGVEVHVYEANHGFNCDQRGSYNEAAAKLAKQRTLDFFTKHLG
ncbi:MAG: dienelactone hydrolase family protein [Polaromonas sp.]|uniref:dienelactone hydrolase family protein n=1 Tax=Polaromonas sp. TaxID=1869339 RepID=UPI002735E535|nr:dienelactone hydrolase family protein [Polaromonas sp.]MDP2817194.1 dienelactone hydrolase family protein [Polaromonas sp.]